MIRNINKAIFKKKKGKKHAKPLLSQSCSEPFLLRRYLCRPFGEWDCSHKSTEGTITEYARRRTYSSIYVSAFNMQERKRRSNHKDSVNFGVTNLTWRFIEKGRKRASEQESKSAIISHTLSPSSRGEYGVADRIPNICVKLQAQCTAAP